MEDAAKKYFAAELLIVQVALFGASFEGFETRLQVQPHQCRLGRVEAFQQMMQKVLNDLLQFVDESVVPDDPALLLLLEFLLWLGEPDHESGKLYDPGMKLPRISLLFSSDRS